MRRLLSNKVVQLIGGPVALMLLGWLGTLLWVAIANVTIEPRLGALETKQAATDTAADALKDDVHYIRDRVDAIYDRLPGKHTP